MSILISKITSPLAPGVTFTYDIQPGGFTGSITTSSNTDPRFGLGSVLIPVPLGTGYSVSETTPLGWQSFGPNPVIGLTVVPGPPLQVSFVNVAPSNNNSVPLTINEFAHTSGGTAIAGATFQYLIYPVGLNNPTFLEITTGANGMGSVSTLINPNSIIYIGQRFPPNLPPITSNPQSVLSSGSPVSVSFENVLIGFTGAFPPVGTIRISKETDAPGNGAMFGYAVFASGESGGYFGSITLIGGFGTVDITNIPVGSGYSVTEIAPSGWQVAGNNPRTGLTVQPFSITPVSFFNQSFGTIQISKVTSPATPGVDFSFTIAPGGATASGTTDANGGFITSVVVPAPGTYTVTENPTFGWTAGTGTSSSQIVSVETGVPTYANFFNTSLENGTIIVQKQTAPPTNGITFSFITSPGGFTGSGTTNQSGFLTTNIIVPAPFTYSVFENTTAGWTATTNPITGVAVTPGMSTIITFNNTFNGTGTGTIHITKTATSATGLGPTTFNFTTSPFGLTGSVTVVPIIGTVTGGVDIIVPTPNTYTIFETIPPGWSGPGFLTGFSVVDGGTTPANFLNTFSLM